MLKQKLLFAATSLFALMLVSTGLRAQYDDMYYDPDDFQSVETSRDYYSDNEQDQYAERDTRRNSDYNDDYHDYYYSSRIRRFNRPYAGFGYYDPVYVDMAYYDPFFRPAATTVLIYNSFGSPFATRFTPFGAAYGYGGFNSWNRGYGGGFGYNNAFYGNRWDRGFGNPYGFGGYGSPFGFGANGYGGFGGGAAYYCPPAWGNGNSYAVPNSVNNRPVSNTPRAATTSIADRVARARQNTAVNTRSANPGSATRTAVGRTRSTNESIDRTRTTVSPRSNATRSTETGRAYPRTATPSRSYTPSRSGVPSRSVTPSRSATPTRSAAPTRSATPSRNYTPTRSATPQRSYTPSPSRSTSPSASPSRSSSPSPSRSSTPTRRGGGGAR